MTALPESTQPTTRPKRRGYRLLAIAVSLAAGALVWLIATIAGVQLEVNSPLVGALAISLPLVIATATIAGCAAMGLLVWLERWRANAHTVWTVIAVAVLAISLLSIPFLDATITTKTVLAFLHLAVGVPPTLMLGRNQRGSRA